MDAHAGVVLHHVGGAAAAGHAVFVFNARRHFVREIGARQRAFMRALGPYFVAFTFALYKNAKIQCESFCVRAREEYSKNVPVWQASVLQLSVWLCSPVHSAPPYFAGV